MLKNIDYRLFFTVLSLIVFGMIMISSVSIYSSFRVTDIMAQRWIITEAYNHFYVLRNIAHVVIALCVLAVCVKIPYTFFEKYSKHFFAFTIGMLMFVLVSWLSLKWASGWISIPWIPFTIQPTEFLKISIILFLAYFLKKNKHYIHTFQQWFVPFIMILWGSLLLVALQPDFGTIMVVVPVCVIMFFAAGANVKYLSMLALIGVILSSLVYSAGDYDPKTGKNLNKLWYITQRIDNFLADNQQAIQNKTINYQTEQSLIAIGSGGFFGLGFGQSIQKFGYLPEVQGDFIFAVIIEELWFIGGLILLCMYLYIGYRGYKISSHVQDSFARYSAIGISSWILIQAFINIWVNLNIVPLTWITLPFISYGGSSLLSLAIWLGVLLNISRHYSDGKYVQRQSRKKIMFRFK